MHDAKDGGLWKMMSEKKEAHFPTELWRPRRKKDSAIKRELCKNTKIRSLLEQKEFRLAISSLV